MVREYAKGTKVPLSKHFASTDFDCHCHRSECRVTNISEELVVSLEEFWAIVGPFEIDSGFRCHAHNLEVGGKHDSRHLFGDAADCKSKSGLRGNLMARSAERVKLFREGGIGIYPTFAHLDVRGYRARWSMGIPC